MGVVGIRLVFATALLVALGSLTRAERLPIRSYSVADGLPHNEINKIVRDSRGFLWFCTADGLSRFDGYTFTNFGTEQGLPHADVLDLLETRKGEYWVATGGGLVLFNPRGIASNRVSYEGDSGAVAMFTTIVPNDNDNRTHAITVLLEDRKGSIWCGSKKGLFKLETTAARYSLIPVDIGLPNEYSEQAVVADLLEDRFSTLWIATPTGLYRRWLDGYFARYTKSEGMPGEYLQDLLEDDQGRLWVTTRLKGFFRLATDDSKRPPTVAEVLTTADGLPSSWVFQLFESSDHRYWVATSQGLAEFFPDGDKQGKRFHSYTIRNGLSYQEITALNEDLGGNLWLGTNGTGVMKLARNGFVTFDERDGLLQVATIFSDHVGSVCFKGNVLGDNRTSIFEGAKVDHLIDAPPQYYQRFGCFDGQHFDWFKPGVPFSFGWVMEDIALQARSGEMWLGGDEGLYRFPVSEKLARIKSEKPLAIYTVKDGLAAAQIFRLFEDSVGRIWISTISSAMNGLARWEPTTQTIFDLKDTPGLPALKDNLPRSFGEDSEGHVWVGFNNGIARYSEGTFKVFGAAEGLAPGAIMNLYGDHAGKLWLASSRSGLIRVDNQSAERPSFINYTTAQGLGSNNVEVIVEDTMGHLYVGGGHGLDRLDPASGRVKHFTTADGLAPGLFRTAFRDRNGMLWFGMTHGLSRFSPVPDDSPAPPAVLITGLRVSGSSRHVSALGETDLTLPDFSASDNQLQFDFVALGFGSGEVLRYQYKLEGADRDWSALSEQRTVNYASLAPGSYRFLVRAANSDSAVSAFPASVRFTILHPFWQRWWFLLFAALFVGLAFYALYRYRVSRLIEFANMRTRIATDLHDDIGSGLSRVAILSEVVKQRMGAPGGEHSGPMLTEIADSARDLVGSMRDIVWAIDPRRDDLSNLIFRMRQFASDILEPQKIKLDVRAPSDLHKIKLNPDQRRHLFLIFKEAINNVARHASCTSALSSITVSRNRLVLELEDDGRGFSVAPPLAGQTNGHSAGHGLENMRRRANELNGKLIIESESGKGTRLRLTVPL